MGRENYISFMKKLSSDEDLAKKAINIRLWAEKTEAPPEEYTKEFEKLVREAGFVVTEDELDEILFYAESIGLSDDELDMAAGGEGIFSQGDS